MDIFYNNGRCRNRVYMKAVWAAALLLTVLMTSCSAAEPAAQVSVGLSEKSAETGNDAVTENPEASAGIPGDEVKVEISMEEAVALGQAEADTWYENMRPTDVHSFDNDASPHIDAGKDGKRQWWSVNFSNEDYNYVSVLLKNREIVDIQHFDENYNLGVFDFSEVCLTSAESVEKAVEFGLRGGDPAKPEEWITGYNYKLAWSSLAETPDELRLFYEVIAISPNGNFARVDFDALTGELLLAEERIDHPDGSVEWKSLNGK